MNRRPLCLQFPRLFAASTRKNKTIALALDGNSWVGDLRRPLPPALLPEFINLWRLVSDTPLLPGVRDSIRWSITASGTYSASSAYKLQFTGRPRSPAPTMIWKPWAPVKCKITTWLLLQDRLWCNDRLQR
jgi:hypothetical protein